MRIRDDLYLVASGQLGFDWTNEADCNVYAVDTGAGLVLIDSGTGLSVDLMQRNLQNCGQSFERITDVLLTHLHADHSGGAYAIRQATGAKVAALEEAALALEAGDEEAISLPAARAAGLYDKDYRWSACPVDRKLSDGESLTIGECQFTVLHTPGHSQYDTCYYMERETYAPVLFSGDTVMYGGRISMLNTKDFNLRKLADSIARLTAYQPEVLLGGHGQPALSRAWNHVQKAHEIFQNLGVPANIGQ